MTKYIVDLSLDGYMDEKKESDAGLLFIEEYLDTSASSVSASKLEIPPSLRTFMKMLKKEAQRDSFVDLLDSWGLSYDKDYKEISNWFEQFGVSL